MARAPTRRRPPPRATAHRDDQRRQPEHRPEVVGAELDGPQEDPWEEPGERRGPEAHPQRKQPPPEGEGQDEESRRDRQHREPHGVEQPGPLGGQREQRREQQVEERRVVVEEVAVLDQALRPAPRDVQVLRFVAVEAKGEDVDHPQGEIRRKERRERCALDAADSLAREPPHGETR